MTGGLRSTAIWLGASGLAVLFGILIANRFSTDIYVLWFASPPAWFLTGLILLLGGPAAILIAGIVKRRLGMIIGPLLLIPIVAVWVTVSDRTDVRAKADYIAALDARLFSAPESQHDLIAQEYSRSSDCDQLCQLILVTSNYAVAVGGTGSDRIVYRKISHAECLETQYVRRNVRFFGICATAQPVQQIGDALLIETPDNLGAWNTFPELDRKFDGMAFALLERRNGVDRVLGRWIFGQVRSGSLTSDEIGRRFTRDEFYRAALGMRLEIGDLKNATWLWQGL